MLTYEILDEVINRNGKCSAAILPLADYEVAVLQNEERKDVYCKSTTVIRDGSFHFKLDLVFYYSPCKCCQIYIIISRHVFYSILNIHGNKRSRKIW